MSRKLFVVAATITLVLATLVAPAAAAPLNAQDVALGQTETGSKLGSTLSVLPLDIQPNGGCESGGAGGCPVG
jgi:hypothetical protein